MGPAVAQSSRVATADTADYDAASRTFLATDLADTNRIKTDLEMGDRSSGYLILYSSAESVVKKSGIGFVGPRIRIGDRGMESCFHPSNPW